MKRHESLAPLSREHHSALILAQLLKRDAPVYKGLPTDTKGKIIYAMNLFNISLKEHFRKEELMIEKIQHCHNDIKQIGMDIRSEHEQLSRSFLMLDKASDPEESLNSLGNALDKHIRKEERILFPLIQKYCSEKELKEIDILLQ